MSNDEFYISILQESERVKEQNSTLNERLRKIEKQLADQKEELADQKDKNAEFDRKHKQMQRQLDRHELDISITIHPIARNMLHELFITISSVMNPHLDITLNTNTRQNGKTYTLLQIRNLSKPDFLTFMTICSQKSIDRATRKYGANYNKKNQEELINAIADTHLSEALKNAIKAVASSNRITLLSRHNAAHVMTLDQLRHHAAKICTKNEKKLYQAIFGRRITDPLPKDLVHLEFHNGWHHPELPSSDSLSSQ